MKNNVRVIFEGYRTTSRSVAMLEEARRHYGKGAPRITQGGYNAGGVSASAGTHDRDAFDFSTKDFSSAEAKRWQLALWRVGFAAWLRPYIAGTWPAHTHAVAKGGDLSAGARRQVSAFKLGRDGLARNARYPGIITSGFALRTFETYVGKYGPTEPGRINVVKIAGEFKSGGKVATEDAKRVQRRLKAMQLYSGPVDGKPGPMTRAAWAKWQQRTFGVPAGHAAADGIPGTSSLSRLGFEPFTPAPVVKPPVVDVEPVPPVVAPPVELSGADKIVALAKSIGMHHVDELRAACSKYDLGLSFGLAILQKESFGRNIYGSDAGGALEDAGAVTEQNFAEFVALIASGVTSNGVGPMQITWKPHFETMQKLGLRPWVPAENIEYGVKVLAESFRAYRDRGETVERALWLTAKAYNGADAYADDAMVKLNFWLSAEGKAR